MTEKTVDELTAELNLVKKVNLEIELAKEKEKEAKHQEELTKQAREQLKEEIKQELGYNKKSKLDETGEKQSMNLTGDKEFENFKAAWIRTRERKDGIKVQGLSYVELMERLANGEYATKGV
jgi:hypothetical protein